MLRKIIKYLYDVQKSLLNPEMMQTIFRCENRKEHLLLQVVAYF